jgi:hypothetical protein
LTALQDRPTPGQRLENFFFAVVPAEIGEGFCPGDELSALAGSLGLYGFERAKVLLNICARVVLNYGDPGRRRLIIWSCSVRHR